MLAALQNSHSKVLKIGKNRARLFLLPLLTLCLSISGKCQFNLLSLAGYQLGGTFNSISEQLSSNYSKSWVRHKSDILGIKKIELNDVDFDYYGTSNYEFTFIKDTLTDVHVKLEFKISDTAKFFRLIRVVCKDIGNPSILPISQFKIKATKNYMTVRNLDYG